MTKLAIRFVTTALVAAICIAAVGVGALAATVRIRGGEWRMPVAEDVESLVVIIEPYEPDPARTIFLQREALTVQHGADDASRSISSLVAPGGTHTIPRYRGTNKTWNRLVTCVEDKFKGLDVRFTDVEPAGNDHVVVKVGGKQSDIGKKGKAIGGIAPFNGDPLNNVIVYAFDQGGKYRTRTNCETVAHEIGHIYGLDHSYQCRDVMSYLQGCGKKSFVDANLRCGEHSIRNCAAERPTQNAQEQLYAVLGAAREQ